VYHIEHFQAVQYVQNDRHCQRLFQHGQSDINEFVKTVGSVDSRRLIIHIGDCQDTYDQNGHDITVSSPDIISHYRPESDLGIREPFLSKGVQSHKTESFVEKTVLGIQDRREYKADDQNGKYRGHIHYASVEILGLDVPAERQGKQKAQPRLRHGSHNGKQQCIQNILQIILVSAEHVYKIL